jgi:MFS family permease
MNLVLIGAAPSTATLILIFILAGVGYAFQQSLERAIVADIAPAEVRGTGFGVLAAVNGVGDLFSSAIVGALWTLFSPRTAFSYAFILTVLGAIVTLAALRTQKA